MNEGLWQQKSQPAVKSAEREHLIYWHSFKAAAANGLELASPLKSGESSTMKCLPVLLSLTAFSSMIAQGEPENAKKRLVFPSSGEPPAPKATPAPKSPLEPSKILGQFFEDLKADKLDSAYQGLVKNTIISERTENIDQLKTKTRQALDNYGPVKGYEVVETLQVGDSLFRHTCLSLNEDVPLRWRFYFYRSGSQWKIIDLRVDDGIADLFEEVARSRKK